MRNCKIVFLRIQQSNLTAKHVEIHRFSVEKNFYITLMQNRIYRGHNCRTSTFHREEFMHFHLLNLNYQPKNALLLYRVPTNTC